MIFKDLHDTIVRIPDDKLCAAMNEEEALVWCYGDMDDDGRSVTYSVSRDTFIKCLQVLGDTEIE